MLKRSLSRFVPVERTEDGETTLGRHLVAESRLFSVLPDRFLSKHHLVGLQGLLDDGEVRVGRRGHQDGVHAERKERVRWARSVGVAAAGGRTAQ